MLFWSSSAFLIAARAGLSKRLLILDMWDKCARRLSAFTISPRAPAYIVASIESDYFGLISTKNIIMFS